MTDDDGSSTASFDINDKDRLIFQSRPVSVTFKAGSPAGFRFEGFEVTETFAKQTQKGKERSDQSYVALFTKKVQTEKDIEKAFRDFRMIKIAIAATWQFIFGFSYGGDVRDHTTSPAIAGWSDNSSKVRANFARSTPMVHLEIQSFPVVELHDWPLKRILHAVSYYKKADETYRFLMALHAKTLNTDNNEIRMTLLGKLADLCETLLPGDTRKTKIMAIPEYFRNRLVLDDDVFRIANTRSVTRHAAQKGNKRLHPIMTSGEREDFQSDVDTLARYLAFRELQMRPCFYEGWRFPPNCAVRWSGRIGKERSRQRDAKDHGGQE